MLLILNKMKDITVSVYDTHHFGYSVSGGLTSAGLFLQYLPTLLNIVLSCVGIAVGIYTLKIKKRQSDKMDKESELE